MSEIQDLQNSIDALGALFVAMIFLQGVAIALSLGVRSYTRKLWKVFCDLYGLRSEPVERGGRE